MKLGIHIANKGLTFLNKRNWTFNFVSYNFLINP